MIQFEFFYRPRDTQDPRQRGEVNIETARPNNDCWSCRTIISAPIAFDHDLHGNDQLQAVELSLNFVHRSLTNHPEYDFFLDENNDTTSFDHFQPMTWTNLDSEDKEVIDENE